MDQDFVVPTGWWPAQDIDQTVIDDGVVPNGSGSIGAARSLWRRVPVPSRERSGETETDEQAGAPTASAKGEVAFVVFQGQLFNRSRRRSN